MFCLSPMRGVLHTTAAPSRLFTVSTAQPTHPHLDRVAQRRGPPGPLMHRRLPTNAGTILRLTPPEQARSEPESHCASIGQSAPADVMGTKPAKAYPKASSVPKSSLCCPTSSFSQGCTLGDFSARSRRFPARLPLGVAVAQMRVRAPDSTGVHPAAIGGCSFLGVCRPWRALNTRQSHHEEG